MFTTFRLRLTAPATPTPSNHSMPSILQSIFETPPTPCNSRHRATKKQSREDQDENLPFASSAPLKKRLHMALQTTPGPGVPTMPRQYTPRQTKHDKLNSLFDALDAAHWTLREFLYYTFRTKDEHGVNIHRTAHHSKYSQHFLQGTSKHTPATILDTWFRSPDGRISEGLPDLDLMYSIDTPYTEIKPVRAALTLFAAQLIEKKLVREAKDAVKVGSGLHASSKRKIGSDTVQWSDVGSATVLQVADVIQKHQPFTWNYMMHIAMPESRSQHSADKTVRMCRPTNVVSSLRKNSLRLKVVSALECLTGGWVGRSAVGQKKKNWNPPEHSRKLAYGGNLYYFCM